jgi:hypothetical protein
MEVNGNRTGRRLYVKMCMSWFAVSGMGWVFDCRDDTRVALIRFSCGPRDLCGG